MDLVAPLLHISMIHILMAMVPGPNTVVISHLAASHSRRAGLLAASGVAAATLLWVVLSLAGVGLALAQAGAFFHVLRLGGALYLLYVGWRMIRSARTVPLDEPPVRSRFRSPLASGFVTTLSNPKSAVFWTGVFALVVPPNAPLWFDGAAIAIVTLQSVLWYSAVALTLSAGFARRRYERLSGWLDRLAGIVMIGLGLKLAEDVRAELVARSL